ncbi:MAG: ABC transporter substrate-binding protein [Caldilineaceae bacterium]|nr:ABC transporter substrate-binding protein [Caldilineaceae bacterium]
MNQRSKLWSLLSLLLMLTLVATGCVATAPSGGAAATTESSTEGSTTEEAATEGGYVIGVSNTLVGNGWREQMICAIKAQATASGLVDSVVVVNRNGGPTEQIADLEGLISQGVDAIIINPTDREGLNAVIEAAIAQGIVVVAVDQAVTAEGAYVVTNDQTAYAQLGAEWLFEKLGGQGAVVEMRGIDGVPADTDRHNGFLAALEKYPDIEVVAEVFTGWDPSTAAQQALDLITTREINGIWTSGTDYTTVEQFQAANKPFVPIVGADNNGFVGQLIDLADEGLTGAAVTNPPAIGAVGVAIALDALTGKNPPQTTLLTPQVFSTDDPEALQGLYAPDQQPGWSTYVDIAPYTSYNGSADVSACKGPGE